MPFNVPDRGSIGIQQGNPAVASKGGPREPWDALPAGMVAVPSGLARVVVLVGGTGLGLLLAWILYRANALLAEAGRDCSLGCHSTILVGWMMPGWQIGMLAVAILVGRIGARRWPSLWEVQESPVERHSSNAIQYLFRAMMLIIGLFMVGLIRYRVAFGRDALDLVGFLALERRVHSYSSLERIQLYDGLRFGRLDGEPYLILTFVTSGDTAVFNSRDVGYDLPEERLGPLADELARISGVPVQPLAYTGAEHARSAAGRAP